MFEEYKQKVFNAYKSKLNAGSLSLNLSNPSPARLKAECILKLNSTLIEKDEKILTVFFERTFDINTFHNLMLNFDSDKFRPLYNFLKGRIENTDNKNIELLAWLIDFEKRPYQAKDYTTQPINSNTEEITTSLNHNEEQRDIPNVDNNNPKNPNGGDTKNWFSFKNKNVAIGSLVTIATVCGLIINTEAQKKQCMYWKTDHYVEVSCDEKPKDGVAIIAIDTSKLNNFKKVLMPDTLTLNDVGKIWYTKIKSDSVEFYTARGNHPILTNKLLKPATEYIINKYCSKKMI
jgi:hypothetical protein